MGPGRVIIGIDVGFTGTGVCYKHILDTEYEDVDKLSPDKSLRVIQDWPGNLAEGKVAYKVPTILGHKYEGGICDIKFGFELSNMPDDELRRDGWEERRAFKLFLDKKLLEDARESEAKKRHRKRSIPTHEQVCTWYTQYLKRLYQWIQRILGEGIHAILRRDYPGATPTSDSDTKIDEYERCKVKFIFSVPTIWDENTSELFRTLVTKAGFGGRPNHSVKIGRNEAEAAAIYTLQNLNLWKYVGGHLISCDGGGGTSDVTSLRLSHSPSGSYKLVQLRAVERPIPLGSEQIDDEAGAIIDEKLCTTFDCPSDVRLATVKRAVREFQTVKHLVGTQEFDLLPAYFVPVVVPKEHHLEERDTSNLQIKFEQNEVHGWFNALVDKIAEFVNVQISCVNDDLRETAQHGPWRGLNTRTIQVYLALTGGLGSSPYVKKALAEHVKDGETSIAIIQPSDPQLAVCKGIVIDHILQKKNGNVRIIENRTRASYGILVREFVKKKQIQLGRKAERCPVTKKWYYDDSIEWLIDQNTYDSDAFSIQKQIFTKYTACKLSVVLVCHDYFGPDSQARPKFLTHRMIDSEEKRNYGGVRILRKLKSEVTPRLEDLRVRAVVLKRGGMLWPLIGKKEHLELTYEVRIRLSGAAVKLELWFGGRRCNKEKIEIIEEDITGSTSKSSPICDIDSATSSDSGMDA